MAINTGKAAGGLGRAGAAGMALALLAGASVPALAAGLTTTRVSVGPGGVQGDRGSQMPSISTSGRFVAFRSDATNLVSGDANGVSDVFVRDLKTGTTERASVGLRTQADGGSYFPALSSDGRFVAFWSYATNLVPGDTNGEADMFVRDRQTSRTERVSVSGLGLQGDKGSHGGAISADGRFVAFASEATNLVPDDTNNQQDVFVRDRETKMTTRVSVGPGGIQADLESFVSAISADGRFVLFYTSATNLVSGDTGQQDMFVHDRQTKTTTRVSVGPGGTQANNYSFGGDISANGRFVSFMSDASNLVPGDTNNGTDIFVRDRKTGTTERVSVGPGGAQAESSGLCYPGISEDGRFVAFASFARDLVAGDTNQASDVFVHDRRQKTTTRVSVGPGAAQANKASSSYSALDVSRGGNPVRGNGYSVVYGSEATNLVKGDTNAREDVFLTTR